MSRKKMDEKQRGGRPEQKIFPFAALVGQERMKASLLVNAVDPSIGGVLIRGEKGTGKTTIVRALTGLLPHIEVMADCPYHCDPHDPETLHDECREKIAAATAATADTAGVKAGSAASADTVASANAAAAGIGADTVAAGANTGVDAAGADTGTDTVAKADAVSSREIPVPLVELPLNATEERVAGAIHLEETLRTGKRHFEPGLLAAANRGILYIDEVNLLEDHLVDLILDAAATGIHRVEREGFSLVHSSRFILIGTMNPEEGELRPQFIDRFGLCATIKGAQAAEDRKEIARRRIAFEQDPDGFVREWKAEQEQLRRQIIEARARLREIKVSEELWTMTAELSTRAKVQGHRSDIVMIKTARAFAALNGRGEVCAEDIREAARLALPHRIAGAVDDTPESSSELLDKLIGPNQDVPAEDLDSERGMTGESDDAESMQVPGSAAAGSIVFDFLKKKSTPRTMKSPKSSRPPSS